MKRQFALMLINAEAPKAGVDYPTCSPPPPVKATPGTDALKAIGAKFSLATFTPGNLAGPPAGDMTESVTERVWPVSQVPRDVVMLIGGSPDAAQLKDVCATLAGLDFDFIVVVDALDTRDTLTDVLVELNEALKIDVEGQSVNCGPVQLTVVGALVPLIKTRRPMLYAYAKADATTTTAVIIDAGTPDAKVLSIVRDRAPFKDMESLPGGFLNIFLEDLPTCSARELGEECHLHPSADELVLIDVRSSPSRDERGHVIDHGYAWFVPADKKAAVLAAARAGDDAKPGTAKFVPVADVLTRTIAFDHYELLVAALKRVPASK